jgi:hypothetical protein
VAPEEKRAWVMAAVAIVTYAGYLAVVLGRAADTPLPDVPYVSALLWSVGISIAASIVLTVVVQLVTAPREAGRKDQRDREIGRFAEYVGQTFITAGAIAALVMAMLELDGFWIANTIYLACTLSLVLGSATRIVAYRRGIGPW